MNTIVKKGPGKGMVLKNIILLLLVVLITIVPLLILKDAEFAGADGEAEEAITKINEDYEPWFSPILEPKSGEIESLLFALQAALGAGFIGYYIGFARGRKRKVE